MTYTIIGLVDQPIYNPRKPYFMHDDAGHSRLGIMRPNGEAGHTVTVSTDNPEVAKQLLLVFQSVFQDAEVLRT